MELIVIIKMDKTNTRKYAALIGRTSIKDFILTYDDVAIALAMNMTVEQIKSLDIGAYKIN